MFVSPVQRMPTQGRDKQRFMMKNPKTGEMVVGKAMDKTRADGTEVVLKFLIDYNKNRYITGLDELIPNPFLGLAEEDVLSSYNLTSAWREIIPKLVKQSQISRQNYFEI